MWVRTKSSLNGWRSAIQALQEEQENDVLAAAMWRFVLCAELQLVFGGLCVLSALFVCCNCDVTDARGSYSTVGAPGKLW